MNNKYVQNLKRRVTDLKDLETKMGHNSRLQIRKDYKFTFGLQLQICLSLCTLYIMSRDPSK